MKQQTEFTISELCSEFSVTSRSLRFYEDRGLLQPQREGSKRLYNKQDRITLILILRGKRLGFSIAEIKELLSIWDNTPDGTEKQLKSVIEKIQQKRIALDQQLRDIAALQLELDQAEDRCQQALNSLVNIPGVASVGGV